VKKVLEQTELIPRETTVLVESPPECQVLECHEEFYDAIMAEEQDEEDESDDQELLPKHHPKMVCSNHVLWRCIAVQIMFSLKICQIQHCINYFMDLTGMLKPGLCGLLAL
jgi:hypothetical protein